MINKVSEKEPPYDTMLLASKDGIKWDEVIQRRMGYREPYNYPKSNNGYYYWKEL